MSRLYPVDRRHVYLLGYSAGGSRVLAVAKALEGRLAGIVSLAGDVARPVRATPAAVSAFAGTPILLICNSGDHGPNASCDLDERNRAFLAAHGARNVTRHQLESSHAPHFELIAPVLDEWLKKGR
jgi:poly(3-hydroxybutyrate) depolymerase